MQWCSGAEVRCWRGEQRSRAEMVKRWCRDGAEEVVQRRWCRLAEVQRCSGDCVQVQSRLVQIGRSAELVQKCRCRGSAAEVLRFSSMA